MNKLEEVVELAVGTKNGILNGSGTSEGTAQLPPTPDGPQPDAWFTVRSIDVLF
ncbi:hypothetical protein BDW67DRAFT_168841 [Aspergillus spinulosporus]